MKSLEKEKFFEKYEYLEKLLKHYDSYVDKNNMNMEQYLILINRIIFKYSSVSNKKSIEQVKNLFNILIENSVKLDNNSILFKTLVYFIQNGFDLFIQTIKSTKVTSEKEFIKELLYILDSKEIAKSFNLNPIDIENELDISVFKGVIIKKKLTFVKKIFSFPLFFFIKFIQENDKDIKDKIIQYIDKEYINEFYHSLDLGKKLNSLKKIINSELNEEQKEFKKLELNEEKKEIRIIESNKEQKNEIKNDLIGTKEEKEIAEKDETKQNLDNSSNKEKDKNEKSEDSFKSEQIIIGINGNSNEHKENQSIKV